MMNCLLIWSLTLMHGVWLVDNGIVRLGYGSRAALWVKFSSEFKSYDGVYTFQRVLELLAAMGTVVGDLTSLKPRKNGCTPRPRVPRPPKRSRRSILLDVFSGFQSLLTLLVFSASPTCPLIFLPFSVPVPPPSPLLLCRICHCCSMGKLSSVYLRPLAFLPDASPLYGAHLLVALLLDPTPLMLPSLKNAPWLATTACTGH